MRLRGARRLYNIFKTEGSGDEMQDEKTILRRAEEFIDARAAEMAAFSDWLAEHPELSGEEYESSRLMAEKLRGEGFEVEYPFCGIPTAFMAKKSFGAKKPAVAIMAEYDALPGIGHGCGHNLHGTMSLYAGLALGEAMAGAGLCGELRVVGTPAEEGDGAKIKMADDGVFDDADLAVMIHSDAAESLADYRALGLNGFDFTFTGQTAHSAGSPWDGRSAQNGALLFMEAMNMLRLHMRDGCRLHAIITQVDGAANIIPDKAVCRVEARAPEKNMLDELTEGVFRCARGAAVATATEVSWERFEGHFEPVLPNPAAEKLAEEIMAQYGVECTRGRGPQGSSDVGNVSYRCPAIQPELAITERKLALHTREFAAATMTDEGHAALVKGTKILAAICLRVFADEKLRLEMHGGFEAALKQTL